jgi:hypothetical protein
LNGKAHQINVKTTLVDTLPFDASFGRAHGCLLPGDAGDSN